MLLLLYRVLCSWESPCCRRLPAPPPLPQQRTSPNVAADHLHRGLRPCPLVGLLPLATSLGQRLAAADRSELLQHGLQKKLMSGSGTFSRGQPGHARNFREGHGSQPLGTTSCQRFSRPTALRTSKHQRKLPSNPRGVAVNETPSLTYDNDRFRLRTPGSELRFATHRVFERDPR